MAGGVVQRPLAGPGLRQPVVTDRPAVAAARPERDGRRRRRPTTVVPTAGAAGPWIDADTLLPG